MIQPRIRRRGLGAIGLLFLAVLASPSLHAQDYPLIRELSVDDILFKQVQDDLARFHGAFASGSPLPALALYRYKAKKDENLFTISSRLTLPYETIATLNRIAKSEAPLAGATLLLPNMPGIFLPEDPASELERLMNAWRNPQAAKRIAIAAEGGGTKAFFFYAGERFHPVERAFFLDILFRFPAEKGVVTSRYGTRISPITGKVHFHNGIDLAAPLGSLVFAARDGKVIEKKTDSVLGNYLILAHAGGYETVYGHLDSFSVELNQNVRSGMMIGRVGTTGNSTGPHLHFEVRRNGESKDPQGLLPRKLR